MAAMEIRDRWHRLRLDFAVTADGLRTRAFWRGAFIVLAALSTAQIIVWDRDLRGWQRDGLQCLPLLLVVPWIAAGRRRLTARRLDALPGQAANDVTVPRSRPLHSDPGALGGAAERRRWFMTRTARWHRQAGPVSAGWISCSLSRVSACWQRWRCRGSGT